MYLGLQNPTDNKSKRQMDLKRTTILNRKFKKKNIFKAFFKPRVFAAKAFCKILDDSGVQDHVRAHAQVCVCVCTDTESKGNAREEKEQERAVLSTRCGSGRVAVGRWWRQQDVAVVAGGAAQLKVSQVLRMDGLVVLQDLYRLFHWEPLPLSTCRGRQSARQKVNPSEDACPCSMASAFWQIRKCFLLYGFVSMTTV